MGEPSVFLRTWGCSLRCSWCDSSHSYEGLSKWKDVAGARQGVNRHPYEKSPHDIAAELMAQPCRRLIITGGEPLLQSVQLEELLRKLGMGWTITIETNGMHTAPRLERYVDLWSISPKLPSSKMPLNEAVVQYFCSLPQAVFKFVVKDHADIEALKALMRGVKHFGFIYVQPDNNEDGKDAYCGNEEYLKRLKWLDEAVKADDWMRDNCRIRPQMHTLLHGREKGT